MLLISFVNSKSCLTYLTARLPSDTQKLQTFTVNVTSNYMRTIIPIIFSLLIISCKQNSEDFSKYLIYEPSNNSDTLLVYKDWFNQIVKTSTKLNKNQIITSYNYDSLNQLTSFNTKKLEGYNLKLKSSKYWGDKPHVKHIIKDNYLSFNKDSIATLETTKDIDSVTIKKEVKTKFIGNSLPFNFNNTKYQTVLFEYKRTVKVLSNNVIQNQHKTSGYLIYGENLGLIKHGVIYEGDTSIKSLISVSN